MNLTICVQCHNFQKRLNWSLASLAQQKGINKLNVNVACIENNGNPTTEEVIGLFRSFIIGQDLCLNLEVGTLIYEDILQYERRGIVRSQQIQECNTEFILFSDCDIVYCPTYFVRLQQYIEENDLVSFTGIISAGRMSQENETIEETNQLINQGKYPRYIVNAYEIIRSNLEKNLVKRRNVGGGSFQLIREDCTDGYYVTEKECKDGRWSDGIQRARSDVQFRHRIGNLHKLPEWFNR